MAKYEVVVSEIDLDFSTNINEVFVEDQSDLISSVIGKKWILGVEAEKNLIGPLCQKISNETGCLVRDIKFTAKIVE